MAIRKRYLLLIGILVVITIAALLVIGFLVLAFAYVQLTTAPSIEFSSSDSLSVRVEKVEAWLDDLHSQDNFNGAVLVKKDGQVALSKCCGYKNASEKEPLTPQTSMRLASVSKQFTAAAILVLAQQEKVGLDDPVVQHLTDFPFEDVTVRHLLNMTSGIPDCYMGLATKHKGELGDCLTIADVPKLVSKYPPKRKKPNEEQSYSNTNYVLLAAIVESASGFSFEDFMADEIFEPLGMKNTRVWNLVSKEKSLSQAETFNGRKDQVPSFIDGVAGDGAVFCSLDDFVIWDEFWRGNDLVSPELMEQAFHTPTLNNGSVSDYGFGWVITGNGHWHHGAWLQAWTYTFQNDDFYVVVLENGGHPIIDSMGQEIRRALDGAVGDR